MSITPTQTRAARAALGMSADDLSRRSLVSTPTIRRFEGGQSITPANRKALRHALEEAGIVFIDDNGIRWNNTDEGN